MASTYELIVQATDQATRPLRNVERALDRVERQSQQVTRTLRAAGGALAAFVTGRTLRSIVTTTARFEDLQDTLNTVTGSAYAGSRAFGFIQDFATRTQFGVEDLTTTFIKLQGAGIAPTEELLTTFTDTAAVTTDQLGTLEAMADLFSRTTAGGLGLEELNRLADRGVPVFRILEEQLGLTRLEISDFGKTAEGAEKIRQALVRGLNDSFGGATQGKLDNLSTAMSNFGIAVTNAANEIGNQFRPQLTAAINDATNFINTNHEAIKTIGTGLRHAVEIASSSVQFLADNFNILRNAIFTAIGGAALNQAVLFFNQMYKSQVRGKAAAVGLGNAFKNLGSNILKVVPVVGGLLTKLGGLTRVVPVLGTLVSLAGRFAGPLGIALTVITAVTAAFDYFKDSVITVGNTTTSVGEIIAASWWGLTEIFSGVAQWLVDGMSYAFNTIAGGLGTVYNFFSERFGGILSTVKSVVNIMVGVVWGFFEGIWNNLRNVPAFFAQAFSSALNVIAEFATRAGAQIGEIWDYITSFGEDEVQNRFSGLGDVVNAEIAKIGSTVDPIDWDAALGADYIGTAGAYVSDTVATMVTTIGGSVSAATEDLVQNYRAHVAEAEAAAKATEYYDDHILRLARTAEQTTDALGDLPPAIEETGTKATETAEKVLSLSDIIKEKITAAGDTLTTELATALRTGKGLLDSFKNFFNRILDDILQAVIEKNITEPLVAQLTGLANGFVGGGGGGLGGMLGGLFGGGGGGGFLSGIGSWIGGLFGFANGGYPTPNKPAIVGEKGPELFIPSATGKIVPNDQLGGGEAVSVVFNINSVSTKDGIEFLLENKPTIVSMIQQASNKRGRAGILD